MPIVTLCGLEEAGKTSIKIYLENIDRDQVKTPYRASENVEVYREHYLTVYVIPGQESFRYSEFLYEKCFQPSDRIGFVVDASDRDKFGEAKKYWEYVKKMIEKYAVKKVEVILVAHKQDKEGALDAREIAKKILSKNDI